MKHLHIKIILTVVTLTLINGCAGTQDLAPDGSEIPTGVNTIIVHSELNEDSAFKEIGNFLIQKGYSIRNTSPEFHSLETNYKRTSRGAGIIQVPLEISINASVNESNEGSQITFYGKYKSEYGEDIRIEQKGASGSVWRVTWDEFYGLAKSYSDSLTFKSR